MLIIFIVVTLSFARSPKETYDLKSFEQKDDKMSEMYSLDRQVQLLQIKVKQTEFEISSLQDEIKEHTIATAKNAAQLRLSFLQKTLAMLKKSLHENAQDAVKFYGSMGAEIQKEFDGLYNYKQRIGELRGL